MLGLTALTLRLVLQYDLAKTRMPRDLDRTRMWEETLEERSSHTGLHMLRRTYMLLL